MVFQRMLASVDELVAGAHADGELRSDVTADDVLLLLGLLTRPLESLPLDHSAVAGTGGAGLAATMSAADACR